MSRTIIVPKGLVYKKRTQTRVGGSYIPRYNKAIVAGGKKTAFRYVRYRRKEYRKKIFQFRITREDGTIIDETTLRYYGQGINIYQKKDEYPNPTEVWHLRMVGSAHGRDKEDPDDLQYWTQNGDMWNYKDDSDPDYIVEFSYNTITKIWTVPFYEWQTIKKNEKCFVRFICDDSIQTWYAASEDLTYIYKDGNRFKDNDRIKSKFYEATVPYWKTTYSEIVGTITCVEDSLDFDFILGVAKQSSYIFLDGGTYEYKLNIKSSIPYKITWKTRDRDPRTKRAYERWNVSSMTFQFGECWNGEEWVPLAHKCCEFYETPYASCFVDEGGGGSFNLTANTINLTITDSAIPIQEDVVEFEGDIEGIDHIATITGGGIYEAIPVCDEGPKAISCDPCENAGNTPFTYTHWFPGVYICVTIGASYDY